jgi:hypothetical protein
MTGDGGTTGGGEDSAELQLEGGEEADDDWAPRVSERRERGSWRLELARWAVAAGPCGEEKGDGPRRKKRRGRESRPAGEEGKGEACPRVGLGLRPAQAQEKG